MGVAADRAGGAIIFAHFFISETVPMIDAAFRTLPDRDHRALAGVSMGGTQSFQTAQDDLKQVCLRRIVQFALRLSVIAGWLWRLICQPRAIRPQNQGFCECGHQ